MTPRSLVEHRAAVLAALPIPQPLDLGIADAVGCVTVEDVVAADAVPPVAVAEHDGYAIHSSDSAPARQGPVTLPVVHDVLPGGSPTRILPGTSARIARGGSLPFGADAVISHAVGEPLNAVVSSLVAPGDGVVSAGADAAAGEVLVPAGTRLAPGHVAVLAACGVRAARVIAAPRVVIVAIGTELEPHARTTHASVRAAEPVHETSGALLAALSAQAGARVVRVVTVPDDAQSLRAAVEDAAVQAELVVTLGGTSGDWKDVVEPVLSHAFGVTMHHVRLGGGGRHGIGHVEVGHGGAAVLLALPGHPIDAVAAFVGYVREAIVTLRGLEPSGSRVRVTQGWESPAGSSQAVAVARVAGEKASVAPVGDPAHPTLRDLARADGLALVDEAVTRVAVGDALDVVWWER